MKTWRITNLRDIFACNGQFMIDFGRWFVITSFSPKAGDTADLHSDL
jgi:hypothetical protein